MKEDPTMTMATTNEMTVEEVADRVGKKPLAVRKWIRKGLRGPNGSRIKLAARKIGSTWLVTPAALDDFSRKLTEAALSK